jgi:hypothetical protein
MRGWHCMAKGEGIFWEEHGAVTRVIEPYRTHEFDNVYHIA